MQIYRGHRYRLWKSIQIIAEHTPSDRPLRVLELGSAPYFFSALMFNYFEHEVIGSNVQAGVIPRKAERIEKVTVKLRHGPDGRIDALPVYLFNFELDRFPFEDGEFDLVICMEVIEHLAYSPSHMLAEAHRVLKPGGIFLLTTPNAIDLNKTVRMFRNKPIAFVYSGYGVYGRHNREFTGEELAELTRDCGYEIKQLYLRNVYQEFKRWPLRDLLYSLLLSVNNLPLSYFVNKRDYIFLVAQSTGNYRLNYYNKFYYFPELYDHLIAKQSVKEEEG
jgi:SAM-dependent methyltransferase